ncbi:MAG: STAS domain-containing protein [Muribaculaceae bacterium]|nr:STAS domain-containing protein [Muribaculaceae bacterium]
MDLSINNIDGALVARLAGSLDTAAAQAIQTQFEPLMEHANGNIVLDCAKLDYISSSGLRLFLLLNKRVAAQKGNLTIENLNNDVMSVFKMTGFDKLFNIK